MKNRNNIAARVALLSLATMALAGCGLLGSGPKPTNDDDEWLTLDEAYEDQMAHTGMDGGAFVMPGLKIRDPHEIARMESPYSPERYALNNGSLQTLETGGVAYVRHADELVRCNTWVYVDGKCYYMDESGNMAKDTYAFDGFWAGSDGSWDSSVPRLCDDTQPLTGKPYHEEGKSSGRVLTFDKSQDGTCRMKRSLQGGRQPETFLMDAFGRGVFALQSEADTLKFAHLSLLPDGKTAIFSRGGVTERYSVE